MGVNEREIEGALAGVPITAERGAVNQELVKAQGALETALREATKYCEKYTQLGNGSQDAQRLSEEATKYLETQAQAIGGDLAQARLKALSSALSDPNPNPIKNVFEVVHAKNPAQFRQILLAGLPGKIDATHTALASASKRFNEVQVRHTEFHERMAAEKAAAAARALAEKERAAAQVTKAASTSAGAATITPPSATPQPEELPLLTDVVTSKSTPTHTIAQSTNGAQSLRALEAAEIAAKTAYDDACMARNGLIASKPEALAFAKKLLDPFFTSEADKDALEKFTNALFSKDGPNLEECNADLGKYFDPLYPLTEDNITRFKGAIADNPAMQTIQAEATQLQNKTAALQMELELAGRELERFKKANSGVAATLRSMGARIRSGASSTIASIRKLTSGKNKAATEIVLIGGSEPIPTAVTAAIEDYRNHPEKFAEAVQKGRGNAGRAMVEAELGLREFLNSLVSSDTVHQFIQKGLQPFLKPGTTLTNSCVKNLAKELFTAQNDSPHECNTWLKLEEALKVPLEKTDVAKLKAAISEDFILERIQEKAKKLAERIRLSSEQIQKTEEKLEVLKSTRKVTGEAATAAADSHLAEPAAASHASHTAATLTELKPVPISPSTPVAPHFSTPKPPEWFKARRDFWASLKTRFKAAFSGFGRRGNTPVDGITPSGTFSAAESGATHGGKMALGAGAVALAGWAAYELTREKERKQDPYTRAK